LEQSPVLTSAGRLSGTDSTMISLTLLCIVLFASTNVDDLLLLLSCFADHTVPRSAIVCGQYIGVTFLVLGSLLLSEIAVILPPLSLRLLGVIPLAIGLSKVPALFGSGIGNKTEADPPSTRGRPMWGIAALTVSSGGDNVGAYLPFFATHPPSARLVIIAVFLLMTGIWCIVARWLTRHRVFQPAIQRWGHRLLPVVLIVLGMRILFPANIAK
jgi:cadmium resistance protein CadD (predicted permease)